MPVAVCAGAAVRWSWVLADGADVGFAVVSTDSTGRTVVVPAGRFDCTGAGGEAGAVEGEYIASSEGLVTLIWDNTYSWVNTKSVSYTLAIESPPEPEPEPEPEAAPDQPAVAAVVEPAPAAVNLVMQPRRSKAGTGCCGSRPPPA